MVKALIKRGLKKLTKKKPKVKPKQIPTYRTDPKTGQTFLNRMLGYHWKVGEKYYATQLTDYDPAVNNGNWQWIASTGVDPKPYFQRLFNPILQSKK